MWGASGQQSYKYGEFRGILGVPYQERVSKLRHVCGFHGFGFGLPCQQSLSFVFTISLPCRAGGMSTRTVMESSKREAQECNN